MNNELTTKEAIFLKENNYAKQDIFMSVFDFYKVSTGDANDLPRLNKVTKIVNNAAHYLDGPRPTYRDAFILQNMLCEAGSILYEKGHSARINENSPEKFKVMVDTISKEASQVRDELGLRSQVVFETTFYYMLKKCGMGQGSNSKNALIETLERLGSITHIIYKASDFRNGVKSSGFNDPFIKYEYSLKTGIIRVKLNCLLSTALTGQFTLINLDHKIGYIKNEKYLAVYDYISGKVNKGERKSFFLDEIIKTVEHIPSGEVSKYLRNKYKKVLEKLNENKIFGDIELGNRGKNSVLIVDRVYWI